MSMIMYAIVMLW